MINFIKKFKPYTWFGLRTMGGKDGIHFCIAYAGKCVDGWKDYYHKEQGYKYPWQKWFKNPIFHNRSHYDEVMGNYRVWFIFMWHIIQW